MAGQGRVQWGTVTMLMWLAALDFLPLLLLCFAVSGKSRSRSPSLSHSDSELDSDSDEEGDKVGWTVCVCMHIKYNFF